jgi:hypothetical protein
VAGALPFSRSRRRKFRVGQGDALALSPAVREAAMWYLGLPGASQHPEYDPVRGTGAGSVQGVLAGLSAIRDELTNVCPSATGRANHPQDAR